MTTPIDAHVLTTLVDEYRRLKSQGDRALAQITSDDSLNLCLDPEANSIVVLVRHLAGNFRSRWTDILTTDGEKPSRDRDNEFDQSIRLTREEMLAEWENGWAVMFKGAEALTPADLARTITVGGKEMTLMQGMTQNVSHAAQHVGQMVLLAKHVAGPNWQVLSIPRGQSKQWYAAGKVR
jgi:hypothetical protein